jgi:hypothetical protein
MSETSVVELHLAAAQLDDAARLLFASDDNRLRHAGRCLAGAATCLREACALQPEAVPGVPPVLALLEPEGNC